MYSGKVSTARRSISSQLPLAALPAPVLDGGPGGEVDILLQRAAAATASDDGIIAVVDRGGRILGVRVEAGVSPTITGNPDLLTFAVDGAVVAFFREGDELFVDHLAVLVDEGPFYPPDMGEAEGVERRSPEKLEARQ